MDSPPLLILLADYHSESSSSSIIDYAIMQNPSSGTGFTHTRTHAHTHTRTRTRARGPSKTGCRNFTNRRNAPSCKRAKTDNLSAEETALLPLSVNSL